MTHPTDTLARLDGLIAHTVSRDSDFHRVVPALLEVVRAANHRTEHGGHSRFCAAMLMQGDPCSCGDDELSKAVDALDAAVGGGG